MTIARSAYTDAAVLPEELQRLFTPRYFVGTQADYEKEGQYRAFQLEDRVISCRKTAAGVRAFNNVCLHRNALIDPLGCGERAFRCRYHGWRYDDEGKVSRAPFADTACITRDTLTQYAVVEEAGLFFVGEDKDKVEVDEVSRLAERLEWRFSKPFEQGSLVHRCNWKLLVENVLEAYHVGFVHQETFGESGVQQADYNTVGEGDYTLWQMTQPQDEAGLSALSYFPDAKAQYLHGYVFPNVFMANTNNLIGYVGWLEPLAVDCTRLHWQLFELPALQRLPSNVREQIRQQAIETHIAVLNEDKVIVESCQQGLSSVGQPYQLQPLEQQLAAFHKMHSKKMG